MFSVVFIGHLEQSIVGYAITVWNDMTIIALGLEYVSESITISTLSGSSDPSVSYRYMQLSYLLSSWADTGVPDPASHPTY